MKTKRAQVASLLLFIVLAVSLPCTSAHADVWSYNAATVRAKADERIAWVYGGAIVLAGVAIGAGVFFGLRSRQSKNKDE